MTTQTMAEYYCERCGSAVDVDVRHARRGSRPGGGILTKLLGGGSSDGVYGLTVGGTYMLCFGCRQYVCAHCWNEAESRCRTCSPAGDGSDATPALPPFAAPADEVAEAPKAEPPGPWPASDLRLRVAEPRPAQAELESVGPEPEALEASEPVPTEAEPAAPGAPVTADSPIAEVYQPRVHRTLRVRSKRVAWRARSVQQPGTPPATIASTLARPASVEPPAELASLEPADEIAPPQAQDAAPPPDPEPEQQAVPPEELIAKPSRRRPGRHTRPSEMRLAPEASEPAATTDVPAGPEVPVATEPPVVPEPLPASGVPTTDGMPALPDGWRVVAGDSAPPHPPAPTTTPTSAGLPLGVVRQIAAETQHRIAAAWAPQGAAPNHRAPQVHGCVNCALPLSATARFCRRCGSQQA